MQRSNSPNSSSNNIGSPGGASPHYNLLSSPSGGGSQFAGGSAAVGGASSPNSQNPHQHGLHALNEIRADLAKYQLQQSNNNFPLSSPQQQHPFRSGQNNKSGSATPTTSAASASAPASTQHLAGAGNGNEQQQRERMMLNAVTVKGFTEESAWHALKLTKFESVDLAVTILNRADAARRTSSSGAKSNAGAASPPAGNLRSHLRIQPDGSGFRMEPLAGGKLHQQVVRSQQVQRPRPQTSLPAMGPPPPHSHFQQPTLITISQQHKNDPSLSTEAAVSNNNSAIRPHLSSPILAARLNSESLQSVRIKVGTANHFPAAGAGPNHGNYINNNNNNNDDNSSRSVYNLYHQQQQQQQQQHQPRNVNEQQQQQQQQQRYEDLSAPNRPTSITGLIMDNYNNHSGQQLQHSNHNNLQQQQQQPVGGYEHLSRRGFPDHHHQQQQMPQGGGYHHQDQQLLNRGRGYHHEQQQQGGAGATGLSGGIQSITIGGGEGVTPPNRQYIESLLNRAESLLDNNNAAGKQRDSTASSASESGYISSYPNVSGKTTSTTNLPQQQQQQQQQYPSSSPHLMTKNHPSTPAAAGISSLTSAGLSSSPVPSLTAAAASSHHQKPLNRLSHHAAAPTPPNLTLSFNQIMTSSGPPTGGGDREGGGRNSPGSTVSTESSSTAEGSGTCWNLDPSQIVRSVSPLPVRIQQRVNEDPNWESPIKPTTPKAFKFFMEQHVENVIKQHTERSLRCVQLEHEMTRASFETPWKCQMKRILATKESRYLRQRRQKMNKSMFEHVKTIGIGAFGQKDTKALYAMKTLRKSKVIANKQAAHVKAERDILSEAAGEYIVKLYYSFQDAENLFFIMEYIPGGDMMSLLIKKEIFEEELARFYISELVLAIESVHRLGFIHRDIKPDNIVITKSGHIKLTDFGLSTGLRWTHDNKHYNVEQWNGGSRHVPEDSMDSLINAGDANSLKLLQSRQGRQRKRAHSLVGTPNYIAPEVLRPASGHTQLCDWWSVGVILYEMVVGYPPFHAPTPAETQLKVINWQTTLQIPRLYWDRQPATSSLILALLRNPEDRLGKDNGAVEIKKHRYFQNVDFENLRQSTPPYVPTILHETDTSNFDPPDEHDTSPPPSMSENAAANETKESNNNNNNNNNNNHFGEMDYDGGHLDHSNNSNNNNINNTNNMWGGPNNNVDGSGGDQSHHYLPNQPAFYEFTFRRFFDSDPLGCPTLKTRRPSLGPLMAAGIQEQQANSSLPTNLSPILRPDPSQLRIPPSSKKNIIVNNRETSEQDLDGPSSSSTKSHLATQPSNFLRSLDGGQEYEEKIHNNNPYGHNNSNNNIDHSSVNNNNNNNRAVFETSNSASRDYGGDKMKAVAKKSAQFTSGFIPRLPSSSEKNSASNGRRVTNISLVHVNQQEHQQQQQQPPSPSPTKYNHPEHKNYSRPRKELPITPAHHLHSNDSSTEYL